MSNLTVLILCGRSPRHLYVANRICAAAKVCAIVHESGGRWDKRKVKKLLRPGYVWGKGWRWLRDRRRYTGGGEAKFFFGSNIARLDRPDLVHEVDHINDSKVIDLVGRCRPDVIAVFGTSLIKGELLKMGRLGIVNLHGGLSPNYRGADCTFWALYNGEVDQIGCTLHFIDEGIDTGGLIAHVCPEIGPEADELTLFWRAVRDSAEVYAELFDRLEEGQRFGLPQTEKGQLYQVRHRSWKHERELARRLKNGLLSRTHMPLRVRWYPKDA